ncbi:GNAT family N-acetyltransferase [Aquabacter sp. CN5-332]|uniref:GNAT family N-acetyltransferase n=1 Tax=Aquabacter sp. CN5-332 TaxID=3156608 RepID=UPI0032B5C769
MSADARIEVRAVERSDHAAWLPLWRAYQAFYDIAMPPDVSELTWSRMLDAAEPISGALAWQGPAAVGLVHYLEHRSTWSAANVCYLQDLFVSPDARGGGIGRGLIAHVYEAADRKGYAEVYWLTHETNATARKLYDQVAERTGFLHYARAPAP